MGYSTDKFCSTPADSFICAICHDVLKDACALNCGHTFCAECIESCRASSNNPSCPNCRVVVTSSNPNYIVREVIGGLSVRCPDSEECEWNGQINDIDSHGNTCMFKTITCDVQGCNHTCQRKDMADHASNTDVKFKHMELKYDKKLKDMKDKSELLIIIIQDMKEDYERKFAEQQAEIQSYKQVVEHRIRALESRKRSAAGDMSNNDSDIPNEMIVEGCGISAINGIYRRNGTYNDAPMYVRSARYNGLDVVFTLFRYGSTGCKVWYTSCVPEGSCPSMNDTDFYYVESGDPLPPRTGWTSAHNTGVDPPPTVRAS